MEPRRDTYVVGYYREPSNAGRATYALVERGFSKDRIQVLSSIPYPHGSFANSLAPSWIPAFSALGGIGGVLVGLAFAAGTALLYPLATGGKPIVALPTVGVITYEFTMLSAILFTVLAFLFFARLPRVGRSFYDARVAEGGVIVAVPCRNEHRIAAAEEVFQQTGAQDVSRKEGA